MFPPPSVTGHNEADPVSVKKLLKGKGVLALRKVILGWIIDDATMCIESEKKQAAILEDLKQALKKKQGLRFKKFEKLVGKLRHACLDPSTS